MAEHKVAQLSALAQGMTAVEADGTKLLLVRDGEDIRVFQGQCPHAKAPLEKGALCRGRIICPWHMGSFDARTGELLEPVAMQGLKRYPTRTEDGMVLVDTAEPPDPAAPDGDRSRVFAIVGTGAAGAMAAVTLRQAGFDGRVVMIGPDPAEPLDRTQLSKMALSSPEFDRTTLPLLDEEAVARLRIERVAAAVTAIDPAARRLTLSDGVTLCYEAALLATGAAPNPVPFPGAGGVKLLRTLSDVDAILAGVRPGARAVIIGTSFIGMEAASDLAERQMQVTVVGTEELPFAKLFGDRIGAAIRSLHESKGITFRLGAKVERVEADGVVLHGGEHLPAELVVAGLGVHPVLDYAGALPCAEDGGLRVDESLRVTDGLWAAGDIASPEGWPRIEHWRVAQQHGRIAALNMAGQRARYEGVPFFWSAQGGKRLQMVGHAAGWDRVAYDGDVEAFDFTAWYLKDGAVQAALICGRDRACAILSDALRETLTLEQARAAVA